MTVRRVTNRDARAMVQARRPFKTGTKSLWGEWYEQGIDGTEDVARRYCVFSYRYTWPLFVAEESEDGTVHWYENIDRFSVTTSRHRTAAHPYTATVPMTCNAMQRIVRDGIAGLAAKGELE